MSLLFSSLLPEAIICFSPSMYSVDKVKKTKLVFHVNRLLVGIEIEICTTIDVYSPLLIVNTHL